MAEQQKKKTGPKKSKSVKKRERQNLKRRLRNQMWKSRIKTAIKKVKRALEEGSSQEVIEELARQATSVIHKAAQKGVIHDRTAARKISRLYLAITKHLKKTA